MTAWRAVIWNNVTIKFEMMWQHIVTSYVLLSKISDVTKQDWAEPVEQKNLLNWRASKQFG